MRETHSTNISGSPYSCPFCKSKNLTKHKIIEKTQFLFIELSSRVVEEYIECKNCYKTMQIGQLSREIVVVKKQDNGMKQKVTTSTFEVGGQTYHQTRTETDMRHFIPDMQNPETYVTTLVLILQYISLKDPSINIENKEIYQFLLDKYGVYRDICAQLIEETGDNDAYLRALILKYFRNCKQEYSRLALNQLLLNSAQVLKGKFIVQHDIELLYFDFFTEIDVAELRKAHFLVQLIA
jgi:hypothetical protein